MNSMQAHYEFREDLVKRLRTDLLGPVEDGEVLGEEPATRYALGVLYPSGSAEIDPSQDESNPEDDDEGSFAADPPVSMAGSRYPSSMGITFAVDPDRAPRFDAILAAAVYEPEGDEEEPDWRRRGLEVQPQTIDATVAMDEERDLGEGLSLFVRVRPRQGDGAVSVTLALVNRRPDEGYPRDPNCFFQPSIEVRAPEQLPCFVQRAPAGIAADDKELESYRLLYRHAGSFATGHGCAAGWEAVGDGEGALAVWTDYVPRHEVRVQDSNPQIQLDALGMKFLADADKGAVLAGLGQLCAGYQEWIKGLEGEITAFDEVMRATAERHLTECRSAAARIRAGVDLLAEDDRAWEAFRLANRAMNTQRTRATWLGDGKPTEVPDLSGGHEWRPFQLAFLLLCLEGVVRPESENRGLVDLLWFPTGGGKTEAYLGLIAFTIFFRRLRDGDAGAGVTALMRYTLRLLTIQQFERAALLICCCEEIRRKDEESRLGSEPIRLGLWVGRGGAPNTLEEAADAIDRLRRDPDSVGEGNPIQLQRCPWCGSRLGPHDYVVSTAQQRMRVRCSSRSGKDACDFADDIPVCIVDTDVYAQCPSLVIATVDKFAGLPWKKEVGRLFGIHTPSPPPELIVQDELHLVSGPLGTLAGLYETAIDLLCSRGGIGPKIVSSTATIRRADRQAKNLFGREMSQFPPPGLDARSSYFAREAPREDGAARLYLGVLSPTVSHATAMIRIYAVLLQSALDLQAPDEVKDPYWTLVGYFNSLRVLGAARMQVQDDVSDRIAYLVDDGEKRSIADRIELTSRESSADLPERLSRMEDTISSGEPVDVVLATNMISVGIDIDRLGLMAVMGQPQSTSEYIQSTSRVGRKHPGLIVTILNASRSRDRSHYESFVGYHSALYRQVESTSVTPFSPRARDRALHAVLVALCRHMLPGMEENAGAVNVAAHAAEVAEIKKRILERVARVEPDELEATTKQLDSIEGFWRHRVEHEPKLLFNQPHELRRSLLIEAAQGLGDDEHLATLLSLRDVDLESNLYMVG